MRLSSLCFFLHSANMVPADKDDEKSLITLACEGNGLATHTLYRLHVRYLTAICSRYVANKEDVKDVLQSSFLKIFTSLDSFEYRGTGSLRAWMVRVVVNESLRFMKSQSRLTFEELPEQYNASDEEPDTSDIPTAMIHEAIRQLPDGYRTIFNLYVIEEKSHKEIASMLNIKESTSASQLHRAKAMLAAKLKNIALD